MNGELIEERIRQIIKFKHVVICSSFQCTFVNEKEKVTVSIDKNVENVILGKKEIFEYFYYF